MQKHGLLEPAAARAPNTNLKPRHCSSSNTLFVNSSSVESCNRKSRWRSARLVWFVSRQLAACVIASAATFTCSFYMLSKSVSGPQGIVILRRIRQSAQGSHHPAAEGAVRSFEFGRLGFATPLRGGSRREGGLLLPRFDEHTGTRSGR